MVARFLFSEAPFFRKPNCFGHRFFSVTAFFGNRFFGKRLFWTPLIRAPIVRKAMCFCTPLFRAPIFRIPLISVAAFSSTVFRTALFRTLNFIPSRLACLRASSITVMSDHAVWFASRDAHPGDLLECSVWSPVTRGRMCPVKSGFSTLYRVYSGGTMVYTWVHA